MKASTPIGPSLGLNAVRLSLLSGAVTAALGAPAMAQESMEIELDPFEHTVFVPGEDTRDVLVTGVKTATITAGFNNVLIAPRVEQETTFRLQGFGVSNALTGVSLVLPAGKGPVNVLASGGTTTIVMDTSNLPEDDGQDGGSGNENPDEDLGAWRAYRDRIPARWINAYDATQQLREKELYDLKAIPALYLLDCDKRVLVKDGTDPGQIEWVIDHR